MAAVPATTVRIPLCGINGQPANNAFVTAELVTANGMSAIGVAASDGLIVPGQPERLYPIDGVVLGKFWPNVRGLRGTQYLLRIYSGRDDVQKLSIVVPEAVPAAVLDVQALVVLPGAAPDPSETATLIARLAALEALVERLQSTGGGSDLLPANTVLFENQVVVHNGAIVVLS